jgi:glyoxylase-like metal-dependent hydrolase (beta-lactamase superfamily II)
MSGTAKPAVKQIADGIYSLSQNKAGQIHAYLVRNGAELILIDTLFDNDGQIILNAIHELGLEPTALKHILLTHAHRSHIGGAAALKARCKARVYSHAWEADIISGDREAQRVSFWPRAPWQVYYIQAGLALGVDGHVPCEVDETVKDGDFVGPLQIVHTPGHTPGHLCFHWPEKQFLHAGDAVATYPSVTAGWAGLTLNLKQSKDSLGKLAGIPAEVVGVGHGEAITEGGTDIVKSLLRRPIGS